MLLHLFRLTLLLIGVYTVRHYWLTLNCLFGRQRHPYVDLGNAAWPAVTVLIAAARVRSMERGKAAALKDAMERVTNEIVLIFDADYIPGSALIRQLVAPS